MREQLDQTLSLAAARANDMLKPESAEKYKGAGPVTQEMLDNYETKVAALQSERVQTDGVLFWTFVGGYGVARFFVEFFREPDPQLGFVLGPFSMGQLLSLAMILAPTLFLLLRRIKL